MALLMAGSPIRSSQKRPAQELSMTTTTEPTTTVIKRPAAKAAHKHIEAFKRAELLSSAEKVAATPLPGGRDALKKPAGSKAPVEKTSNAFHYTSVSFGKVRRTIVHGVRSHVQFYDEDLQKSPSLSFNGMAFQGIGQGYCSSLFGLGAKGGHQFPIRR